MTNDSWPLAALLWLCVYSPRHTFLHIPRTGGSSIESLDLTAPINQWRALQGVMQQNHSAARWRPRCAHAGSFWHWTPDRVSACSPAAWWLPPSFNPYSPATHNKVGKPQVVYCIVREPADRFLSVFEQATSVGLERRGGERPRANLWPSIACGSLRSATQLWDEREKLLRCFVQHTRELLAHLELSRDAGYQPIPPSAPPISSDLVGELAVHLQPQSHFVRDRLERVTCDLPFPFELLKSAGLPRVTRTGKRLAGKDAANGTSLIDEIRGLYSQDVALWQEAMRAAMETLSLHQQHAFPSHLDRREYSWYLHSPGSHSQESQLTGSSQRRATVAETNAFYLPLERAARAYPRFVSAGRPSCTPGCAAAPDATAPERNSTCECAACISASLASRPSACIECVLDRLECGGHGPRTLFAVDRKWGPVCSTGRGPPGRSRTRQCNVCSECCDQLGGGSTGASCLACEASNCTSFGGAAGAQQLA